MSVESFFSSPLERQWFAYKQRSSASEQLSHGFLREMLSFSNCRLASRSGFKARMFMFCDLVIPASASVLKSHFSCGTQTWRGNSSEWCNVFVVFIFVKSSYTAAKTFIKRVYSQYCNSQFEVSRFVCAVCSSPASSGEGG